MRTILFLFLILLIPVPQASAHNLRVTLLTFDLVITDKEISLYYITGVNAVYASKIAKEMDTSPRDMHFSEQEKETWCMKRLKNIEVFLNDKKMDFEIKGWEVPLFESFLLARNEDDTITVKAFLKIEGNGLQPGTYRLRMIDRNLEGTPRQFTHQVIFFENMTQKSLEGIRKETLEIGFSVLEGAGTVADINAGRQLLEREASGEAAKKEGSLAAWSEKRFKALMKREEFSIYAIGFALILSLIYGMSHAISPGHGKTMVAAYLVGCKGRILDAVFLGMVVTLTHTGSVLLLGAIVLWLQEFIVPETLTLYLSVISGFIVFLLGVWLFISRVLLKTHFHPHAPEHEHPHHHGIFSHKHMGHEISDAMKRNVSWGELLLLGMSGGMIPCPAALVVLLAAIVMKKLVFGIALILCFSAGMAMVLITIGVLMVVSKNRLNRFERFDAFFKIMPVISAVGVMVIGVFITFQALMQGEFVR